MAKKFEFGKDIYYFNVKGGGSSNITIKRIKKEEALHTFKSYQNLGKDCEWLGKWDGKKFVENTLPKE